MPRGDGTGPAGNGPKTGRAAGYCTGNNQPGYMNVRSIKPVNGSRPAGNRVTPQNGVNSRASGTGRGRRSGRGYRGGRGRGRRR